MKVNLLKNKKIITVAVLGIIGLVFFLINCHSIDPDYIAYDRDSAEDIRKCVSAYIFDSKDYELKFGGTKSILDVNELLFKLTLEINIEGKRCGPYLLGIDNHIKSPPSNVLKNGYKGWKVVINKSKDPLEAVSVEHYKYNLIEIVES